MKKRIIYFFVAVICTFFLFCNFIIKSEAKSYLSDKTETQIQMDISGANAICQTDDGYVWIGQYGGLTKYESKEFRLIQSFEDEDGNIFELANVKTLVNKGKTLFIQTTKYLYRYENYKFSYIDLNHGDLTFNNISVNDDYLLISTTVGLFVYDINTKEKVDLLFEDINVNRAVGYKGDYYCQLHDGIYNSKNERILYDVEILDICKVDNNLFVGNKNGEIKVYDMSTKTLQTTSYETFDQINKLLYSKKNNFLFVAGENGLHFIDLSYGTVNSVNNLTNETRLVDLMEDYEGNLWLVSYTTGVSVISKNGLVNELFDISYDVIPEKNRLIYSIKRYGAYLYIVANGGVYIKNVNNDEYVYDNPIMNRINEYIDGQEDKDTIRSGLSFRDVELFNGKIYIAAYNLGLIEYDPVTYNVNIYTEEEIDTNGTVVSEAGTKNYYKNIRCLRAFDNYLLMGYSSGIIKFDGSSFLIRELKNSVLYINKDKNNNPVFIYNRNGIYNASSDLDVEPILDGIIPATAGLLKFFYTEDKLYYSVNSKLYVVDLETKEINEIIVPDVTGSIVELSVVSVKGEEKLIIASEKQVYIIDKIENNEIKEYQMLDENDGLANGILANTSGYFDSLSNKYYFQSKTSVFSIDLGAEKFIHTPFLIDVSSIQVDNKVYYGNEITINKDAERVVFNLSAFGFRPHKGYTIYYKLEGVDSHYIEAQDDTTSISYTYLSGGKYTFKTYIIDEYGQKSNEISISLTKPKTLTEEAWFWVLIVIASLIVVGLLNVVIIRWRLKKSHQREMEYRAITIESIEAIARTIDAKDAYTNGHSKRVGIYSREIARALNLSQDEIDNIYYIALLHDIGKISIPLNILNKPGRLTDEEFEIMKSHTTAGGKILEGISTIPNIVAGAMYHHERYGGGGYPKGLKGEEIPFIARIICCADCYDAMATKRVYKDPYPKEKIISEFERCKGTQFDPQIADIVIKLIKEDRLRYGTELKTEEDK